jgi:heme iron utilization protein
MVNGKAIPPPANGATAPVKEANTNIRLNVSEKARTVTSTVTSGTLCTVSSHDGISGAPFGSYVDYVLDDAGNPVLLMNEMSMHTMNIQKQGPNALVSLFTQLGGSSSSISMGSSSPSVSTFQDVSRCSLTGVLEKISATASDMDIIKMRYSLTHAYADQVMSSSKFAFYRLNPSAIYFVSGFGVETAWINVHDYQAASPDILAQHATTIVQSLNRPVHYNDLILTAQHLLLVPSEITRVRVTNIDRLGIDIRVTYQMPRRRNKLQTDEFRIGFRIPVISVEDAKSEVLKIFQEAWEKGNGVTWGSEEDGDVELPGSSVPILKIAADSLE